MIYLGGILHICLIWIVSSLQKVFIVPIWFKPDPIKSEPVDQNSGLYLKVVVWQNKSIAIYIPSRFTNLNGQLRSLLGQRTLTIAERSTVQTVSCFALYQTRRLLLFVGGKAIESKQVVLEATCIVIHPPTMSVIWLDHSRLPTVTIIREHSP